jgi:hypothetical protein
MKLGSSSPVVATYLASSFLVAVMRAGAKREDTRIVRTLSEVTYLEPKFGP